MTRSRDVIDGEPFEELLFLRGQGLDPRRIDLRHDAVELGTVHLMHPRAVDGPPPLHIRGPEGWERNDELHPARTRFAVAQHQEQIPAYESAEMRPVRRIPPAT